MKGKDGAGHEGRGPGHAESSRAEEEDEDGDGGMDEDIRQVKPECRQAVVDGKIQPGKTERTRSSAWISSLHRIQ